MPDTVTTAHNASFVERAPDHELANAIRALAMDAVEKAKSGHPGMPMGMADIAVALWTFIRQDELFECVIGSGKAYRVVEWIEFCFNQVGLDWRDRVARDEKFVKPYARLVSDPARLLKLGWVPATTAEQLAEMMVSAARSALLERIEA